MFETEARQIAPMHYMIAWNQVPRQRAGFRTRTVPGRAHCFGRSAAIPLGQTSLFCRLIRKFSSEGTAMKSSLGIIILLAILPGAAMAAEPAANVPAASQALDAAINGPQRTPAYKARDKFRHPKQTLEFFGIQPGMTVVEVLPGGGWYTEILAPLLRDHGTLIEATAPLSDPQPFTHKMAVKYAGKLAADPGVYGKVQLTPFELPAYMHLGPPDTADMVVTFRNMHDFIFANVHGEVTDVLLQKFLRAAYQVLKPGGILGIVAHRANPGADIAESHAMERLPQAYVIREAEMAGFKLAGTSEINANPKDPRSFPVMYLPPGSMAKSDQAKYDAIGEADNMTLKFVKPAD